MFNDYETYIKVFLTIIYVFCGGYFGYSLALKHKKAIKHACGALCPHYKDCLKSKIQEGTRE